MSTETFFITTARIKRMVYLLANTNVSKMNNERFIKFVAQKISEFENTHTDKSLVLLELYHILMEKERILDLVRQRKPF